MRFEFPAAVMTSVVATDSCYYTIGIIADSIPPYNTGSSFCKFNLEGDLVLIKTLKDSLKEFSTWIPSLLKVDNVFYAYGQTNQNNSIYTLFLKYNENGDTLLTRQYSNSYEQSNFIAPDGLLYRGNKFFYLLSGVENLTTSPSSLDVSLIKVDSTGNFIFEKKYGNYFRDNPYSIAEIDVNSLAIGLLTTNVNFTNKDFICNTRVLGVDSLGQVQWEYLSPEDGLYAGARDMVVTEANELIIASGVGEEVPVNPTASEINWWDHVFKLNSDHELEWEVTLRDPFKQSQTHLNSIISCSDNSGYVVAGTSAVGETQWTGTLFGRIAKISPDGDSLWDRRYIYPVDTALYVSMDIYDVKETTDGGFIFCGEAHATGTNYPQQAWLMKVDEYGCLVPGCQLIDTVNDNEPSPEISIFPNPATDYLNVFLPSGVNNGHFAIVNAEGSLMKQFTALYENSTYVVDVSEYPSGVYFLQFNMNGKIVGTKKFIVQ